jgi:hypothetical protein
VESKTPETNSYERHKGNVRHVSSWNLYGTKHYWSGAATHEFPRILCNPKVHSSFTGALHLFLSWTRLIQSTPLSVPAANELNKQPRTIDKGWSSSLGVGRGANNTSPETSKWASDSAGLCWQISCLVPFCGLIHFSPFVVYTAELHMLFCSHSVHVPLSKLRTWFYSKKQFMCLNYLVLCFIYSLCFSRDLC